MIPVSHFCTYTFFPLQQPFPHESLLIDRRELKLSSDEKKAAKKGYEEEKRASVPYTRPSYAHYYPASDQSLTNIPAFSQRNWSVTHVSRLKALPLTPLYSFVVLTGNRNSEICL